jgi:hypothetical protein
MTLLTAAEARTLAIEHHQLAYFDFGAGGA